MKNRASAQSRQCFACCMLDGCPVAISQRCAVDHPGAANTHDIRLRQILRGITSVDTTGRAEAHICERASQRLERRDATADFSGEQLEAAIAKSIAAHDIGSAADSRQ